MTTQEYQWPSKVDNDIDGWYEAVTACKKPSDKRDSYVNEKSHYVNKPCQSQKYVKAIIYTNYQSRQMITRTDEKP